MRIIRFFAVILISVFLVDCAQTKTVTVTEYLDRVERDTVTVRDSVTRDRFVYIQGDTVHDIQVLERIKYRDRVKTIEVHDSIPYPVTVEVPVHVRNSYDMFVSWGFWILLALIAVAIAWRIYVRR